MTSKTMQDKLKRMAKKQLVEEYNAQKQQVEELSFGTRDLIYLEMIEREIDRRGLHLKYTLA